MRELDRAERAMCFSLAWFAVVFLLVVGVLLLVSRA